MSKLIFLIEFMTTRSIILILTVIEEARKVYLREKEIKIMSAISDQPLTDMMTKSRAKWIMLYSWSRKNLQASARSAKSNVSTVRF